jgi:protein TonB
MAGSARIVVSFQALCPYCEAFARVVVQRVTKGFCGLDANRRTNYANDSQLHQLESGEQGMNAHFKTAYRVEDGELPTPVERSAYRRSRGADPVATIGALALGLATVGAFAWMNPVFVKKDKREATIVAMLELPDDPPPAAETPPPPPDASPPPQPAVVAPVPMVALATAPTIAAPPPVPQPAPPAPKAAPGPGPAVIAKGPENVGDLSAQVVFRKPIRVPLESRRAHEEGIVVLTVLLSVDGRVADISVASSSGFPRLDRAALEAVADWRWSPLVRSGQPVMVRGMVRIPFIRERGDGRGGRGGHGRRHHGDRDGGPPGDRDFDRDGPRPDDHV